jgi:hypothetical protein
LDTSKKSFKSDIKRLGRLDVSWLQHMTVKNIIKLPCEDCRPIVDPTTFSTMHFFELCKESRLQNGVDIYKLTPDNNLLHMFRIWIHWTWSNKNA